MGLSIVRPPIADLVFQMYSRPLHPELFDILAVRRVTTPEFELTVRITRTGHFISWDNGKLYLSEVTVAADQEMPPSRRLLSHKLKQERCTRADCGHGYSYQASFQVETLSSTLFSMMHQEIMVDGKKRGFLHYFPNHHRFALPPLGFLCADFRPGCLVLSSFHTFPGECTVIKTQSLIEKQS
jgi:hypothetical protein